MLGFGVPRLLALRECLRDHLDLPGSGEADAFIDEAEELIGSAAVGVQCRSCQVRVLPLEIFVIRFGCGE